MPVALRLKDFQEQLSLRRVPCSSGPVLCEALYSLWPRKALVLGTNFATEQKEFYLFKGCQSNPCFVLRCFLSWKQVLGGGSPAESCRAGTVKLLPGRAWDKAQNYTDLKGKDNLSLAQPWPMLLQRQFSQNLCPGHIPSPCTHKTIGPALFQARLCQEFCSPSAAHTCGAAHVF